MSDPIQRLEEELKELRREFNDRAGALEERIAAMKKAVAPSQADPVETSFREPLSRESFEDISPSARAERIKGELRKTPLPVPANDNITKPGEHRSICGGMEKSVPDSLRESEGQGSELHLSSAGHGEESACNGMDCEGEPLTLDVDLDIPAPLEEEIRNGAPAPGIKHSDNTDPPPVSGGTKGDFVKETGEAFLEPFGGAIGKLFAAYRYYRDQGKSAEFLMTLSGILALVLGFGYLMQYSFTLLSSGVKAGLGFFSASCVATGGAVLSKRKPEMGDFGAGLIGLGVVLNYLCAYAAGPYFLILGSGTTLFVLLLNTLAAYLLALLFTTRVVSIVTLFGGAFFPLIMGGTLLSPIIFISYLLVLSSACLHLAAKIRWKTLESLTMAVSGVMIEKIVIREPVMMLHLHAFFYLYCVNLLFSEKKLKETLGRQEIVTLTAVIIVFVVASFQVTGGRFSAGLILLCNAGVSALLFVIFRSHARPVRGIFLLVAGFFTGIAIMALCGRDMVGSVLGLEALLLVLLGFKFAVPSVRREGYILLGLSSLMTLQLLGKWLLNFRAASPGAAWGNYAMLGAGIWLIYRLMETQKKEWMDFEKRLSGFLKNCFSFWIASLFQITCLIHLPEYLPVLSIVPCLLLIYRAGVLGLKFTEYLGLAHYGLIAAQVAVSSSITGSFLFFDQPLLGKIAQIELFFSLWGLKAFYGRFHAMSGFIPVAGRLRTLFYLLVPICYLPFIWEYFPEFFTLGLWGSVGICLALCRLQRSPLIYRELELLAPAASLATYLTAVSAGKGDFLLQAVAPLTIGSIFFFMMLVSFMGLTLKEYRDNPFSRILTGAFYHFGITTILLVLKCTGSMGAALFAGSLFFLHFAVKWPVMPHLRSAFAPFYRVGTGLLLALTFFSMVTLHRLLPWEPVLNIAGVAMFCFVVHCKRPHARILARSGGGRRIQLWGLHALVFFTYFICSGSWAGDLLGPGTTLAMVIHGTILLFLTLTPEYRRLVSISITLFLFSAAKILLYDMSGFSTRQKVIAFMGIGVILLFGAYRFQRVRAEEYRPDLPV